MWSQEGSARPTKALRHLLRRDNLIDMKPNRKLPLAILLETYRPLACFAGELLLAASPFLPGVTQTWARKLIRLDDPARADV